MPRASLGGTAFVKNIMNQCNNPVSASVERRWSLVGPSWSKRRIKPFSSFELDKTLSIIEDKLPQTDDEPALPDMLDIVEESKLCENVDEKKNVEIELSSGLENKLKICAQRENITAKVACSPRVRKMGVQRQHKIGLTRTQTWHINSNTKTLMSEALHNKNITVPVCQSKPRTRLSINIKNEKEKEKEKENELKDTVSVEEDWTPADSFFKPVKCTKINKQLDKELNSIECTFLTPKTSKNFVNKDMNMLPPARLPIQRLKTPKSVTPISTNLTPFSPFAEDNGRASIARLRQQNAGMVMAKAKLFDGLNDGNIQCYRTPKKAVNRVRNNVNSAKKITR